MSFGQHQSSCCVWRIYDSLKWKSERSRRSNVDKRTAARRCAPSYGVEGSIAWKRICRTERIAYRLCQLRRSRLFRFRYPESKRNQWRWGGTSKGRRVEASMQSNSKALVKGLFPVCKHTQKQFCFSRKEWEMMTHRAMWRNEWVTAIFSFSFLIFSKLFFQIMFGLFCLGIFLMVSSIYGWPFIDDYY